MAAVNNPTDVTFKITGTKLYVPIINLSIQDDNKLSEQLKAGFKRTIERNKCRSELSNQTKNNNLNYLIDKVNSLFVLSFENENDRTSFSHYYTPNVEIKDFNLLIDGKSFFETLIKDKEAYEKLLKSEEIDN